MSEMVERVARAIDEALGAVLDIGEDGRLQSECDRRLVLAARAAIEAMREPTETMLAAGNHMASSPDAPEVWRAVIDEALK